jgi:hypothetical protein
MSGAAGPLEVVGPELLKKASEIAKMSHSAEESLAGCPYKYKLQTIDHLQDDSSYALILGNAVDAMQTRAGQEQLKGARPSLASLLEWGAENALKEWDLTERKCDGHIKCDPDWNESRLKIADDAVRMYTVYENEVGIHDRPVIVQQGFGVDFPALGARMTGRIDLYDARGFGRDLKTAKAKKNMTEVLSSPQLTKYQVGIRHSFGQPVNGLGLDVLVRYKDGRVLYQQLYGPPRTEAEENEMLAAWTLRLLQARSGIFPKTNDYMQCTGFCGYARVCRPTWYAAAQAKKEEKTT